MKKASGTFPNFGIFRRPMIASSLCAFIVAASAGARPADGTDNDEGEVKQSALKRFQRLSPLVGVLDRQDMPSSVMDYAVC